MKRAIVFGSVIALLLAMLAVAGFAVAQTPEPTATSTMPKRMPAPLPALEGVPFDQWFDHFRGGQLTVADAQGNLVTYRVTAGQVANLSNESLSVTPNGSATAEAFNVTPTTQVRGTPPPGTFQVLAIGDRVVVLSQAGANGSADAIKVAKHDMLMHGQMMGGAMGHGGMMGAR